jgi:hypothetical protein
MDITKQISEHKPVSEMTLEEAEYMAGLINKQLTTDRQLRQEVNQRVDYLKGAKTFRESEGFLYKHYIIEESEYNRGARIATVIGHDSSSGTLYLDGWEEQETGTKKVQFTLPRSEVTVGRTANGQAITEITEEEFQELREHM